MAKAQSRTEPRRSVGLASKRQDEQVHGEAHAEPELAAEDSGASRMVLSRERMGSALCLQRGGTGGWETQEEARVAARAGEDGETDVNE